MNPGINLPAIWIGDGFGAFLVIIMLGARLWKNQRNKSTDNLLRLMMFTVLLSCIADIIAFSCDGKPGIGAFLGVYLGNWWLFLSNLLIGTFWVMMLLSHISGEKLPKEQAILIGALDAVGLGALIVNFFSPVVFSVSAANVYQRGSLFWLFVVIEMILSVDGVITYFFYRKKYAKARYFPVWQFIIPIIVGVTIQSVAYGVSTIWPAMAVSISGIVFGLYNESEAEITALRQHEIDTNIILEQKQALSEALASAESASRAKTEFLFNMSHDIRTPMNAILGYADIALRHEDEPERVNDSLKKIRTSGGHLLSLINDILEMSRIESGKMELADNPMDIREAINNVSQMSQSLAMSGEVELTTLVGDIRDPYILADELHLNEVLINLISNSVKYNNIGGKVEFRTEQLGPAKDGIARFRFTVRDNGIGMSKEFQKHLFEDFARENTTTVSRQEGSGLGLSIVKKIVDLASGTIRVESKKGEGSTFIVEFPFKVMDGAMESEFRKAQESKTLVEENSRLEGRKVLLVEDNDMNREIAAEILEDGGLIVDTAEDGSIAVKAVAEKGTNYYDFILMDIQMPVMDGYEATKALRRLSGGDQLLIIALSANAFKEDVDRSLEAGMNAHVAKPIDIKALFSTMNMLAK